MTRVTARAGLLLALALVAAAVGCVSDESPATSLARPPFPADTPLGTTRTFTMIGDPGRPEGIALHDGHVVVGTNNPGPDPSLLLVFDLATGKEVRRIEVEGQDPEREFGVLGLAFDGDGLLYALDVTPPRVLRLDPFADPVVQEVYATFPDLPACLSVTGLAAACSPTLMDFPPVPDVLAFGPDGAAYVTDLTQATVWRVPPGGGEPEAWLQDARFDHPYGFGPNGVALGPNDEYLYVVHTVRGATTATPGGEVHRVPLVPAPSPADVELFHAYLDRAVDGIAFARSGNLYVTLMDIENADHGISVLAPDGTEVARFPPAGENQGLDVPYDFPANLLFNDAHRSILITNHVFLGGDPANWAVLEAFVDEVGLELHRPGGS